jgi:hypothetical protein
MTELDNDGPNILIYWSRSCGAVVKATALRYDDCCVAGSNPTVGCGCQSFGWDRINRGPVSQQSLLKAIRLSAKHKSKFVALSLVMVTATR